jgi:hypothetical protein
VKPGRDNWPLRERIKARLTRPLHDWRMRRLGCTKERPYWRYLSCGLT